MYHKKVHIHFVGIGGIGMSGIATVLKTQGYTISGCDVNCQQKSIENLLALGCTIYCDNNSPECYDQSINIVVYSSDVPADHPEIIHAQQRGIPTIPRALMLAELMRTKFSIAIGGSHGKTTTTSLISHILMEAKFDPTIIIGGHLKNLSTNARLGLGSFLVAEADESDRSITRLQATLAVITNINLEHLDTYQDIEDIQATFLQFLNNLPFYGKAFLCLESPHVQSLLPLPHIKTITYGLSDQADWYASDVILGSDHTLFRLRHHTQQFPEIIRLALPGKHNLLNSLAAIAVTRDLDVPFEIISQALANFKGVERRFTYRGTYQGAEIFDDYGHHPYEIYNALLVARKRAQGKLFVLFQPHRYSRTSKLWNDFVTVLSEGDIDELIVTDIYPAFEDPITGVTSVDLVNALHLKKTKHPITYLPWQDDFDAMIEYLQQRVAPGDLILLLGAGKINMIAHKIAGT